MSNEPTVIHCTMRDSYEEHDGVEYPVIDIECRLSDGQKLTPIIVASDFPNLARLIYEFLNKEAKANLRSDEGSCPDCGYKPFEGKEVHVLDCPSAPIYRENLTPQDVIDKEQP